MNPPLVFTNDDIEGKKIKQGKRDKKTNLFLLEMWF